ncbi:mCG145905, partial [Mus musculus]
TTSPPPPPKWVKAFCISLCKMAVEWSHQRQGTTPGTPREAGKKTRGLLRVGPTLSPSVTCVLTRVSAQMISVADLSLAHTLHPQAAHVVKKRERKLA